MLISPLKRKAPLKRSRRFGRSSSCFAMHQSSSDADFSGMQSNAYCGARYTPVICFLCAKLQFASSSFGIRRLPSSKRRKAPIDGASIAHFNVCCRIFRYAQTSRQRARYSNTARAAHTRRPHPRTLIIIQRRLQTERRTQTAVLRAHISIQRRRE